MPQKKTIRERMTYGCASWALSQTLEKKLRAFEIKTERKMLKVKWQENKITKGYKNKMLFHLRCFATFSMFLILVSWVGHVDCKWTKNY